MTDSPSPRTAGENNLPPQCAKPFAKTLSYLKLLSIQLLFFFLIYVKICTSRPTLSAVIVKSQIQGRTCILIQSRYSATIQVNLHIFSVRGRKFRAFIKMDLRLLTLFRRQQQSRICLASGVTRFALAAVEASGMNDVIAAALTCLFYSSHFLWAFLGRLKQLRNPVRGTQEWQGVALHVGDTLQFYFLSLVPHIVTMFCCFFF